MNGESDNESIATDDIVEQEVEPDPSPPVDETIMEQNVDVKLNEIPITEPVVKKGRGRPKAVANKVDKTEGSLHALTKHDLMRLVVSQHEVLNKRALIDQKQEEFIKEKVTNKLIKSKKEKKPRTPAQIAATERMIAGRKAKLTKSLAESKKEIVEEIDNSIAERVNDCVTNIIMKPMRSLTPERIKKVENYIEPKRKNYF